jgi:hypothetical protein
MKTKLATLAVVLALLPQCSNSPTMTCVDPCTSGAVQCAGGMLTTCQTVDGCLEFTSPSACPSGVCQDQGTCAPVANCGAFTTCTTCSAPMVPGCFWCPTTNTCAATSSCPGSIGGGDDTAELCAEAASCLPCSLTTLTLCDDTTFQCTCTTGVVPADKSCVLDSNEQYCCSM